jgi:ParB family chromosome partitioning protein
MSLDLSELDKAAGELERAGKPMLLPIELIDEDPEQPRVEFAEQPLKDLAGSIKSAGVKQPISVRPHPTAPGRYMLNFGARRLRASKLAGQEVIPAFIDEVLGAYDQVIENEQREGLTPLELALFVQKRLAVGDSQAQIARGIGKSKMMVTYATALINADDWLMNLYRTGQCTGLAELYELRKLHASCASEVEAWAADLAEISRRDVAALKAELSGDATRPAPAKTQRTASADGDDDERDEQAETAPTYPMRITVKHEGKKYQLVGRFVTELAPTEPGLVFVRKGRDDAFEVDISELELASIAVKRA